MAATSSATVFGRPLLPAVEEGKVPFWRVVLRGISQLGFQSNEITGLLFVVAVVVYGWRTAQWQQTALLIIGAVVGTAAAKAVRPKTFPYELGLLTFCSVLICLAMGVFYERTPWLWVVAAVMAAVVGVISALLDKYVPLPALAVPFIVPFWILWANAESVGLKYLPVKPWDVEDYRLIVAAISGVSSTLFAGILSVGFIALFAIAISSWKHALVALLGGALGAGVALVGQAETGAINAGFTGFNAVLAALAVYVLCGEDLRLAVLGAVGATVLMRVVIWTGLPPLAAGFVLATWAIMIIGWLQRRYWDKLPPLPQRSTPL